MMGAYTINTPVTLNSKAPENPKINGGLSGLEDATSPNDLRDDQVGISML